MNGKVFRAPKRDRYGDPVDDDGNPIDMLDEFGLAYVGTIERVIIGGSSWNPRNTRGEVASTEGMIGCPRDGIKLQHGDRIDIDNVRYSIVGQRQWDYPHSLTGSNFGHYWVKAEAVTN